MTDKEGKIINEPEVTWNHAMDAVRYGMESLNPFEIDINLPDESTPFSSI